MRLTQGTFSFLPDLTDDQIRSQIAYAQAQGWAVNVEYTDDPHPRSTYWELWGLPMFDLKDPAGVLHEINECRKVFARSYIRVSAFDPSHTWETVRLSFIVNRPPEEPGFYLERNEVNGRSINYTVRSYAAAAKPAGERY